MNTFFPAPKHKLIGHRGVAGLRPENTYCSFAYAAELDLNWIEFDVRLTEDENWVVIHDEELSRTTNGKGLVSDYKLRELAALEAGLWYKPAFADQKIPTLEGVLLQAKELNLFCNIEIKGATRDPGRHASLMAQFISKNMCMDRVLVSSFDLPCLIGLRHLLEDLPIGYLVDSFATDTIAITKQYNFNCINCSVDSISVASLDAAKAANIPVFLFTVNDRTTSTFWLSRGAAGVFTDRPDLLL